MNKDSVVVAGAGGHALEVVDILLDNNFDYSDITLFDNINPPELCPLYGQIEIISGLDQLRSYLVHKPDFVLGVGNPTARAALADLFLSGGGNWIALRSRTAAISPGINAANFDVMTFGFVSRKVTVEKGVLLNSGARVHHGVKIGQFSEIAPAVTLLGDCKVGNFTRIGSGTTILPNVIVGNKVTVGAGAVVVKDLPDGCTAVGVPAKIIK